MKPVHPATNHGVSFSADVHLVETLLTDLQAEQAALVTADMALIEQLVDKRMTLLQSLSTAAQARYSALAAAGYEASEKGMTDWLQKQTDQHLHQTWLRFQKQLVDARELNRVNGLLINKHFQRNQERLQALQTQGVTTEVYGKNGQAHGIAKYRSGFNV